MKRRNWLDISFTVTTPMFLSRNQRDQGDDRIERSPAEFRIMSLRGAMGYWFRFLAGPEVSHDIRRLRALEAKVLGDISNSSPLVMRLKEPVTSPYQATPGWLPAGGLAPGRVDMRYLLGQGLYRHGHGLTRSHLPVGLGGVIQIAEDGADMDLILPVLWFLEVFGGIGARVRRGFGGIQFGIEYPWASGTDGYDDAVAAFRTALRPNQQDGDDAEQAHPPFDSVAGHTFYILDSDAGDMSWKKALNKAASLVRELRASVPRPGSTPVTPEYINVVLPFFKNQLPADAPFDLAGFGLPVSFMSSSNRGRRVQVVATHRGTELRRASMLWVRLRQTDAGFGLLPHVVASEVLPIDASLQLVESAPGRQPRRARLSFDTGDAMDRIL